MTNKCSDMRIYENGFMFLGDFIPFNMILSCTVTVYDASKSLLLIDFIYRHQENPCVKCKCYVSDTHDSIEKLLQVVLNQKNIYMSKTRNDLMPIYETDRVSNLNDFRGELVYPEDNGERC